MPALPHLLLYPAVILQVGVWGGHARPGHGHHPTVDLDPVPVRVEEVESMAPATADETLLASLGGVHVGTTDDIHAARAHMVERQEPVLARVDLAPCDRSRGTLSPILFKGDAPITEASANKRLGKACFDNVDGRPGACCAAGSYAVSPSRDPRRENREPDVLPSGSARSRLAGSTVAAMGGGPVQKGGSRKRMANFAHRRVAEGTPARR